MSERHVSADEARAVAEEARETRWSRESFARHLFLGRLRTDLLEALPEPQDDGERATAFLADLDRVLASIDPDQVERDSRLPAHAIPDLAAIGAMGIRIPLQYGGLGLSQRTYNEAVARAALRSGALAALLSAHQSIGVPKPVMMFGTEEQKRRFLPRLAAGAVSGFALTEMGVGSDPARMASTAEPDGNGGYILNGEKLWCTNGPVAELLVVMACTPDTAGKGRRPISTFIVDTSWPGVELVHRSAFMGLRGIENGVIRFTDVRVPAENLLGGEGHGLRIALTTLNTGRLTLPAMCARAGEWCLGVARRWAGEREQWGAAVGRHEAVGAMLAELATSAFAMRAVSEFATDLSESGTMDIRIEAALAKLYTSERAWQAADMTVQVRGGRGYETAASLAARGEEALPVERVLRDMRINRIFEGSSEIMRLFVAREALDPHVRAAGALARKGSSLREKAASALHMALHMGGWKLSIFTPRWRSYREYGRLGRHLRDAARLSRFLALRLFTAMATNGPALERKQRLLGRIVDAGAEIMAMVACVRLAHRLRGTPAAGSAIALADQACEVASRRAWALLDWRAGGLDRKQRGLAAEILEGRHAWIEPLH
jgi:alkylation response protein AidB-like acyl-CoA dehydrogenase